MPNQPARPSCILIHYSEIGLKGQNRPFFQRVLKKQIQQRLPKNTNIELREQRFILRNKNVEELLLSIPRLQNVFGIAWLASAFELKPDIDAIKSFIDTKGGIFLGDAHTFRITAHRADKSFPHTSQEIARVLGQIIVDTYKGKVDLSNPQKEIFVDILPRSAFIYTDVHEGLRGLPVGSSGKVLSLFSGGIDSPVSSWLIMKRGCLPSYIHFHAFRSVKELEGSKIEKLFKILAGFGSPAKVYFIPFSSFQAEILDLNPRYELLLFRRFIVKTAQGLALENGFEALIMGDNLGQVASQTLPYLALTDHDITLPILRPLISYNKEEIITLAKQIKTYEPSIETYKDCCSIVAKHPTLSPDSQKLQGFEKKINLDAIVQRSLKEAEEKEYY